MQFSTIQIHERRLSDDAPSGDTAMRRPVVSTPSFILLGFALSIASLSGVLILPREARAMPPLPGRELANQVRDFCSTPVQYQTPEQEYWEREERWKRERENEEVNKRAREQEEIERRSTWGAIAYSPSTGQVGLSWNKYYELGAERAALSECGRRDCEAVTFSDSCRAVAVGDDPASNGWYDGAGQTEEDASRDAINVCSAHGERSCKSVASHCSPQ
jgi:hypothetical protein